MIKDAASVYDYMSALHHILRPIVSVSTVNANAMKPMSIERWAEFGEICGDGVVTGQVYSSMFAIVVTDGDE